LVEEHAAKRLRCVDGRQGLYDERQLALWQIRPRQWRQPNPAFRADKRQLCNAEIQMNATKHFRSQHACSESGQHVARSRCLREPTVCGQDVAAYLLRTCGERVLEVQGAGGIKGEGRKRQVFPAVDIAGPFEQLFTACMLLGGWCDLAKG